jgi:hypothetical protein
VSRTKKEGCQTMTADDLFCYPYTSFTNVQPPQLKVAALTTTLGRSSCG